MIGTMVTETQDLICQNTKDQEYAIYYNYLCKYYTAHLQILRVKSVNSSSSLTVEDINGDIATINNLMHTYDVKAR